MLSGLGMSCLYQRALAMALPAAHQRVTSTTLMLTSGLSIRRASQLKRQVQYWKPCAAQFESRRCHVFARMQQERAARHQHRDEKNHDVQRESDPFPRRRRRLPRCLKRFPCKPVKRFQWFNMTVKGSRRPAPCR